MAYLRRELGRLVLLLSAFGGFAPAGPASPPTPEAGEDSLRSLWLQLQNEDLAVVRYLNGGDVEAADMVSNRLLMHLDRALADSPPQPYHDRFLELRERVRKFDDEYLDPRTGDHRDSELWPEHISVDWVPGFVEGWRSSWESAEIDRYLSHYSGSFRSGGRGDGIDRAAWGERKRLLARSRPDLRIDIDELEVYRQDDRIIAHFRQDYKSKQFSAVGSKSLVLVREPDGWRITGEYVGRPPPGARQVGALEVVQAPRIEEVEEPAAPEPPPEPAPDPAEELREFVEDWRRAWESKDLPAYLSRYSPDKFRWHGLDMKGWERKKRDIWDRSGSLRIALEDLDVRVDNDRAAVRFVQTYESEAHRDEGRKTLNLVREEGDWRIVREAWVP